MIQREIQEIESMSQLTSIISQTSNEISDTNYQAWERSQQINDKIADDFFDYILDVQTYTNPVEGSAVELPSGYNYAWTNGLGEYILSDSPSYNPNQESNLNWQQMTP